jgi:methyl-accepting chemotaxis protein
MNAGQLAALIAAGFFAVGACAFCFVMARLARLISAATTLVSAHQASSAELASRARAVIEGAERQLAGSAALTDSVQQVSASMSDLSDQVTAVAGTARLIAAGLHFPVVRLAAAGYGFRRAIAKRALASGQLTARALPPGQR